MDILKRKYNIDYLDCWKLLSQDFPGGAVVKNPPANAGDTGLIPVQGDPTCRGAIKPVRHNY